jgi:hypothetical protein
MRYFEVPMKKPPRQAPIKVAPDTLDRTRALLEHIAAFGWSSIGSDRRDPPSIAAVVAEAIAMLEERAKKGRK